MCGILQIFVSGAATGVLMFLCVLDFDLFILVLLLPIFLGLYWGTQNVYKEA